MAQNSRIPNKIPFAAEYASFSVKSLNNRKILSTKLYFLLKTIVRSIKKS